MAAIVAWFRLELQRRWRTLLVLALLVGFAGGTVLTVVAGARRGDTAVQRLVAATDPATLQVLPQDPAFDWDLVRALPGVEAVGLVVQNTVEIDGVPPEQAFMPADAQALNELERPVVLAGRPADPDRADEAVVTPSFVETYGLGVGDQVMLRLPSPEALDGAPDPPPGPEVESRIVGVVRSFLLSDVPGAPGLLIPSAGLVAEHPGSFVGASGAIPMSALVRLADGATVAGFTSDLVEAAGQSDIDVWSHAESQVYADRVAGFESSALLVFAAAAALATVFVVGQAVARYVAATVAELRVVTALGLTPGQAARAAMLGPVLAATAGALLGAAASVAASRWFPYGMASTLEPAPGPDTDPLVLAAGLVGIPALVAVAAAATARLALRALRDDAAPRRSGLVARAARAGLPVPVVMGMRFALEPGRGARAVPVRPALAGAVVGVLGVVGAAVFSAAVEDATGNPARFGQIHQVQVALADDTAEAAMATVAADPGVAEVNDSRAAVAEYAGVAATVYSLGPRYGAVVTDGRLPAADTEVALAPYTAGAMGVRPGDTVDLAGTRSTRELTVTGLAFVPEGEENYYNTGAWVTGAGWDELFDGASSRVAHVVLEPGADAGAVVARLDAALGPAPDGSPAARLRLDRDLSAELQQIRRLPLFLAGFLAVLAVGAVGHALGTAVRRRRHDLAVLRAGGMTRPQCRALVVTQAGVVAVAGLLAGLPLGVALGRTLWRYVADTTMVHYVPPAVVATLSLAVPVTLLMAAGLALWPAHRAAGLRVGPALRAE